MRCWIDFLACLALGTSPPVARPQALPEQEAAAPQVETPASPADAAELCRALARIEGLEAGFDEVKHLAALKRPLKRSGRLYYLRGGWVAQVVEKPSPAIVTITPDELRLTQGGSVDVKDLRSHKEARLFVRSIALVWSGDEEALRETFEIVFRLVEEDRRAWTLALTPKSEQLGKMLTQLVVSGRDFGVRRIEIVAVGERTVLDVRDADPERRFSALEKQRWFGIEPD